MSSGLYSGASGLTLGYALYSSLPSLWGGDVGYSDNFPTPALALDFISYNTLDPRITFSRGSQATLTDSTGKLTYAPNNLLTNSESFDASAWIKYGLSVTSNAILAPNSTATADAIVSDGTFALHRIQQTLTSGPSRIYSVYAKAGTASFMQILLDTDAAPWANFDLVNGVVGSTGTNQTATMTSVGNGWYRCSIYSSSTTAAGVNFAFISSATSARAELWTTSQTFYLWGAQIEAVTYQTTPGTYNSTTPKNRLGYTQEFDNAAWTKSNAFVQTNLLLQSQAFDVAATWASSDVTVSANNSTAPDGTSTADTITEGTAGTAFISQGVTTTGGATYTASIFVRRGNTDWLRLVSSDGTNGYNLWVNTATGALGGNSVTGSGIYTASTITAVGGGWYRVTLTGSNPLTINGIRVNSATANLSNTRVSGATYSLWGAQLVQGSTAGDYQRTDAAAAAVQYVAPDGSRTADKVVVTATTSFAGVSQFATIAVGTTFTFSAYAKMAEWRYVALSPNGSADYAVFDLQNGSIAVKATSTIASIQSVGNGWYRCTLSYAEPSAASRSFAIFPNNTGAFTSQTGDGTSGIYVWGAQLSNSASLDPYVYNPGAAPTSTAYYGPRFDYDPVTLQAKGLLIEEQRTNLTTYSGDTTNAVWAVSGMVKTSTNNADPFGTNTALLVTADGVNSSHYVQQGPAISFTSGTAYTQSIWVKAGTTDRVQFTFGSPAFGSSQYANYYLSGAGSVTASVGGTATISQYANGWYRVTFTATATATTSIQGIFGIVITSGTDGRLPSNTSSGTFYIWGAQLEAGSFATSYIPTVASTVTRSADVATMTGDNFKSWYNQNAGTIVANADTAGTSAGTPFVVAASDGSTNNRVNIYATGSSWAGYVGTGGVLQANVAVSGFIQGAAFKAAIGYQTNSVQFALNATLGTEDTLAAMPAVTQFSLGNITNALFLNGHIRRITYYPQRLPNATLQGITA